VSAVTATRSGAALELTRPGGPVRAIVLVLHGGRQTSTARVRPRQLAVLRMVPFARRLTADGDAHGLAVARLRFAVRGWNGELRSPVADTRATLAELTHTYPDVPLALVGHSMGGRTAAYVADTPAVCAVVALAPWIKPGDPVETMTGCRLLVVHGAGDRMTDPRASYAYARTAAAAATSSCWLGIRGEKHAMLHRPRLWHELTSGFVLGALFGTPARETIRPESAKLVEQALAGESRIIV
jgi:dienelactone hydrolase